MKPMISLRVLVLSAAFLLITPTLFASCNGSQKDTKKAEVTPEVQATDSTSAEVVETGNPIKLNAADFRRLVYDYKANPNEFVYKGDKPAIIDFYADWCGPCRKLAPKLDEVAKKYKGRVVVYKVDVDVERELASTFSVQSIPMVLFVPLKGKPIQAMGNLPVEEIEKNVSQITK